MMTRKLICCVPVALLLGILTALSTDTLLGASREADKQDIKPAVSLPISRVVLFNSGVGYFSRSGEVVDDARIDLMFPEQDINDLLKSMVLEDKDGGRIAAVSYDSREPIARTLSSFAINLNGNPTLAGIISQMRGERVEVVLTPGANNQPGKLTGAIVGVQMQKVASGSATLDVEVLNMWCAEGLRSVKLQEIQQLKFANPVIESEFRRALDVLALSHDSLKKAVSVHFAGEGKRRVQVGYVIEAPIWKTSYRLVMDEKKKPYLQGWAMVENPTDEDWAGVQMALVSGRPISFKMDLYNPLYVERPIVEPELFKSLRPVTYRGGFDNNNNGFANANNDNFQRNWQNPGAQPQNFYNGVGNQSFQFNGQAMSNSAQMQAGQGANAKNPQMNSPMLANSGNGQFSPPYQKSQQGGQQGALFFDQGQNVQLGDNRLVLQGVDTAATAAALGDFFQYAIDHPVSLARQKSALLPIVGKGIEGQRVSIYNQAVQGTHPLLGIRFKNTTGLHLNQGPITVFEGNVYAGDTRVLDVQPNEERLVSYAIDLGMEVDPKNGAGAQKITSVKAVKGIVTTTTRLTDERKYRIVNRSQGDRTLIIEHPRRTSQGFKLVDTDKPLEDTADTYRFQVVVKAGDPKTFIVKEQRELSTSISLSNNPDGQMQYFLKLPEASETFKKKLSEAVALKAKWDGVQRELTHLASDLARLNADQDRIRKNLRETPKEAEVYTVYLKKLSDQEKEIDGMTDRQKKLSVEDLAARKQFEDYLANLTE